MAGSGPGDLIAIDDRLNSDKNIEILEVMIESARSLLTSANQVCVSCLSLTAEQPLGSECQCAP